VRERIVRETVGIGLLLTAVLLLVALLSHSPLDPSPFHVSSLRESPQNLVGWLGATLSAVLLGVAGLPSLVLPFLLAALGWRQLRGRTTEMPLLVVAGWTAFLVALSGFANLACTDLTYRGGAVSCGGLIGRATDELLAGFAGPVGRAVILIFLLLVGLLMISGSSVVGVLDRLGGRLGAAWRALNRRRLERRREEERRKGQRRVLERQLERMKSREDERDTVIVKEIEGRGHFRIVRRTVTEEDAPEEVTKPVPASSAARRKPARRSRPAEKKPREAPARQEEFDFVEELEEYALPRVSFLESPGPKPPRDTSVLLELGQRIVEKCREFKVGGEVVNIRTGPVITTYEFRLDSGVKISAIQNLAEDLALALRTSSVRIDRIPGRATVGIEVPNPDPEVIHLREMLDTDEFRQSGSLLTLSLGVDIHGNPFYGDLQRMPHLLIGGFTGSGKSVGINSMIMSILFQAKPDEVKFIFVDPKMVELGVYSGIPHLLTPIITDPKKAANALAWAVEEMDNRYRTLAALGVRNLEQYNRLARDPVQRRRVLERLGAPPAEVEDERDPLPYIVIVIDELADLMLTSGRAVEESITRLAQKARAVGVHLICATQRPSVDILTGIIKANFPCRIAFKVRSKLDSRTILDAVRAEHLLGRGDMLYLPPGSSNLKRLHGPLVTEKEIATVVRFIKRFGKPEYQRQILSHAPLGEGGKRGRGASSTDEDGKLEDPRYQEAVRLVVTTRKASASFIQRRLGLGYTRSARLLDMMEEEGIVGPLEGSKGREVLVPPDYFGEVDATLALNGPGGEEEEP
jgi:S-DNA-T family DNA segregation ATPase FtsK/SpoIIIE